MCGRLNLSDLDGIRKMMADIGLPLFDIDEHQPRYNIAPTSTLHALVANPDDSSAIASWQQMHWGMPLRDGPLVINARSETVHSKPTFKSIVQQRALVPVNGFYEWQRRHSDKHAWYFEASDDAALALAAIWRLAASGPQLALLTAAADDSMAPVHHRMPIAIGSELALDWLTQQTPLVPPTSSFRKRRVNHWVDNAKNGGPRCLDEPEQLPHTPDLFD